LSRARAALPFLAAALACAPGGAEPPVPEDSTSWPPDTVIAVNDVAIRAADVAPWAGAVALLYPEYTRVHCRRLALTNVLLPRAAAREYFAESRVAAERRCVAAFDGIDELDEPESVEGTWRQLGLEMWSFARQLPAGEWSAPSELSGRWVLVRLEEIVPGRVPQEEKLVLRWLEFPYVDPTAVDSELRAAIDASRLVVVDPAWDETIPENWKHRMRGLKGER